MAGSGDPPGSDGTDEDGHPADDVATEADDRDPTADGAAEDGGRPAGDPATEGDGPVPLTTALDSVAARLREADGLLLALDFDGTLAPIVSDPAAAELRPGVRSRLERLAGADRVVVAVVSGRAAGDVRDRVGVDGIRYVGNHGLERADRDGVESLASPAERAAVRATLDRLERRLADVDGALVERKGPTGTVHHRRVPDEQVERVETAVRESVAGADPLGVREGKEVLEVRPVDGPDKGDAVADLLAAVVPPGERWLPAFVGDDASDEAAFAAVREVGGLAVAVGRDETGATLRVPDPAGVLAFLDWLVESGLPALGDGDR